MIKIEALAEPRKEFFISTLTRDISFEDALLDLIDNSIDAFITSKKIDIYKKFKTNFSKKGKPAKIEVDVTKDKIIIRDDCGGIKLSKAKKSVFNFGSISTDSVLSVYGIGMKRALFKLGNKIDIKSKHREKGFDLNLDVSKWLVKPEWTFEITPNESESDFGTVITITEINKDISARISEGNFLNNFKKIIAKTYSNLIPNLVEVFLNGSKVEAYTPEFMGDEHNMASYSEYERDGVKILILCGFASKPWKNQKAGWYLLCNGRTTVLADKTKLTGWDAGMPKFMPKHRGFVGIVYFFCKNPSKLPWTTTKRGINRDNLAFQFALPKMKTAATPVLRALDSVSTPAQSGIDSEKIENFFGADEADFSTFIPIEKFENVLSILKTSERKFKVEKKKIKQNYLRIQYDAKTEEVEKVREILGESRMSASKVGRYTFDYFIESEVED